MLLHIGLTINDSDDIRNFYEEILLFKTHHTFIINELTCKTIFDLSGPAEVFVMDHHDVQLEIFICENKEKKVFSHVCLEYWKARLIYERAKELGYKAIIKSNPFHDTWFIWDKSGNMFEIKEFSEA